MKPEEMTRDERSFLLYAETRAVDYGGYLDMQNLNNEDKAIGKKWNKSGFMEYGRATKRGSDGVAQDLTYKVKLSDKAWEVVGLIRKERASNN